MADAKEAERLDSCLIAKNKQEAAGLDKRLAGVLNHVGLTGLLQKDALCFRKNPVLMPPGELLEDLGYKWQVALVEGAILALSGAEPDAARIQAHIGPGKSEDLSPPGGGLPEKDRQ